MKNIKIILSVMLAICLSGCQSGAADIGDFSEQSSISAENAETSGEQSSTKPITAETEKTYMEKCSELLAEMPPEEILEKHENSVYPEFKRYTYYSRTAERDTPVNVLLPSDYSEDKEYPVLYIFHGYYDNESWMAREIVHTPEMLTNLVSAGEAKEMIVVLPYIYCREPLKTLVKSKNRQDAPNTRKPDEGRLDACRGGLTK